MAQFFLSRRYRPNIWPFWVLTALEFGLTVALLTFVGIAAPDLYRTKLWKDGADNGFNSSPAAGLYAAANYRPYTTPRVWSQFLTNYNLVIVVLSMFIMLCKSTMYILHVFPPIVSVLVHSVLIVLYAVSAAFQTSSDTSDSNRPQKGAPWYITKSCSVAKYHSNIGYCQQAKATFWCVIVMLVVYVTYFGIALWSCFPNEQQKKEYAEKQRRKREKYGWLDSPEETYTKDPEIITSQTSDVGRMNPMTPRTLAFNKLGGTTNASMKPASSSKNPGFSFGALRSPTFPRTPINKTKFTEVTAEEVAESSEGGYGAGKRPMFFPPPPQQSTKK